MHGFSLLEQNGAWLRFDFHSESSMREIGMLIFIFTIGIQFKYIKYTCKDDWVGRYQMYPLTS